jgi:DNA modification methylase
MALQADGWTLRQTIIWHKPNPMPESVTDRCTKSHEYIFLMTKSPRYFYDAEAIKEKAAGTSGGASFGKQNHDTNGTMAQSRQYERPEYNTRNKRSVWTVTTKSFKEAHFATFPPKLIEPCILAGTSEEGCCPECGQPLRRQLEISRSHQSGSGKSGNEIHGKQGPLQGGGATGDIRNGPCTATTTTGWDLECNCDAGEPVPCTVLDCFGGAGTSGVVAAQHRREAILCELNPEYAEIARKRIERELHEQRIQPRLFK